MPPKILDEIAYLYEKSAHLELAAILLHSSGPWRF